MDEFLPHLIAFPPHPPPDQPLPDSQYEPQIKALLQTLNKIPAKLLTGGVKGGVDLLDVLDPSFNSLPYLYTLLAHAQAQNRQGKASSSPASKKIVIAPDGHLWLKCVKFFERFDPRQIRYVGDEWIKLIAIIARSARAVGKPVLAVWPLQRALLNLSSPASMLTPAHPIFVRLCLEAATYEPALAILDSDVYKLPLASGSLNSASSAAKLAASQQNTLTSSLTDRLRYVDHLEYHLYGAMIYMVYKKWERASQLLLYVVAAPAISDATSVIMVEAYKKWILVGLLHRGRSPKLPHSLNQSTERVYHILAKPYDLIAECFDRGDLQEMQRHLEAGREIWYRDNNTGLLNQALEAARRWVIRKLSNTYLSISLSQIIDLQPGLTQSSDAAESQQNQEYQLEHIIQSMIDRGELNASLSRGSDSSATILTFSSAPTLSEAEQLAQVEAQAARVEALTTQLRSTDSRILCSRAYINWMQMTKQSKKNAGGGKNQLATDAMDYSWVGGGAIEEEDIFDPSGLNFPS